MDILNTIPDDKEWEIFTDVNYLEHACVQQFVDAMKQPFVDRGALMPDAHLGYSLPIGGVVETCDYIVPSYVGFDIGCGMCAIKTTFNKDEVENYKWGIRDAIKSVVPVGFDIHPVLGPQAGALDSMLTNTTDHTKVIFAERKGYHQLGTLGGGNHFIEIGYGEDDGVWIIVHSGSRGPGHGCATHYVKLADPDNKCRDGHYGFRSRSQEGKDYIRDMNFCLEYALYNRKVMIYNIVEALNRIDGLDGETVQGSLINRNHNHATSVDGVNWIHRKGATHAEKGMRGVIPGNMRDGAFIVKGKGCKESLMSSSHGAGRVLGRKAAKRTLDIDEFRDTMGDIACGVDSNTLDESPMAYKDIFKVIEDQKDLIEVTDYIKPIVNVKG